ncbi:MAG: hypothetical protein CMJ32_05905 [Phycisphaerae bacterium]|nr:hypothetical protein [Phycisphaerae bacterium]
MIRTGENTKIVPWTVCVLAALCAGLAAWPVKGRAGNAPTAFIKVTPDRIDFNRQVRPILARNCLVCHGRDPSSRQADLRLDNRDDALAVIKPGNPEDSELLARITAMDPGDRMPPPDHGQLDPDEIRILRDWIEQGAQYEQLWAWTPLSSPPPPDVDDRAWCREPIDHFILADLESSGIQPAPEAEPHVLLRRLAFDLTGLPPNPEDARGFIDDPSEEHWNRLIEQYIDSPHFGEHWARHWMDLIRYAETRGHEFDYGIPNAWKYRDYLINAFNQDVPYGQLVMEHVAGDLVGEPRLNTSDMTNESIKGTGFWFLHQGTHGPVDVRQDEVERVANQIDVLSKTFVGLTVSCARCHDHKFDPITTKDYYALAGFLQSSRSQSTYLDPHGRIDDAMRSLAQLHEATTHERASWILESIHAQDIDSMLDGVREIHDGSGLEETAAKLGLDRTVLAKWVDQLEADMMDAPDPPAEDGLRWIEQFEGPFRDRWFISGMAFGESPQDVGQARFQGGRWMLAEAGTACSGLMTDQAQGTMRSQTFELVDDFIHFRARGTGSRLRLIIDGYRLNQANPLLFEGMIQDVDHPGAGFATYTMDARRYQGHRAHIELIDDGDGYLEVDAIVGSPDQESPWDNHTLPAGPELQARLWNMGLIDAVDPGSIPSQLGSYPEMSSKVPSPARALAIEDGSPEDEYVFIRGQHRSRGPIVPRRFIESLGAVAPRDMTGSGRLHLAEQIIDDGNPLTWRVMANRTWHHMLGRGIVETTDDFGSMGTPPSHPELLDYMADRFRRDQSIKNLVRMIARSSTYRMSSSTNQAESEDRDPGNRLWHRAIIKRLSGESIRDSILATSGRLDRTILGPPVPIHLTPHMTGRGRPGASGPLDGNGRRTIYITVRRNFLMPMLTAFDFPEPSEPVGARTRSNVPAQALMLMNDPFVHEQAGVWAEALIASSREDHDRIRQACLQAYGRDAKPEEIRDFQRFVDEHEGDRGQAWNDLAHVIFNTKEFIYLK